jgi:hypothetical protein
LEKIQAKKITATTRKFERNKDLKKDLQEGYNSKNNENAETFFMDFGGAWQFPLDFFPLNSDIRVFVSQWNKEEEKCNLQTGKLDPDLAKCQIDATVP